MAWIEIISYILPTSSLISLFKLFLFNLREASNDIDGDVPHHRIHATFHTSETVALVVDTLLTIALMVHQVGMYRLNWNSMTSLLPELYLVVLLVARWVLAYHVDDLWAAEVERHSAALYTVRFCCAVTAAVYSFYYLRTTGSLALGLARVGLLGTLVFTLYTR